MLEQLPPGYIANFDSASAMVRATARYLKGKDFPPMGMGRFHKPLMKAANLLARRPREEVYALGGANEGYPAEDLDRVSSDRIAEWAAAQYPQREYPAVMIGSSNGAAVHLCAALGVPWLPQTSLVPVRRHEIHPDDMQEEMEWARDPGRRLLEANPDIQLHQMHDPNQDRLMVRYMTYFRIKRTRLGESYERFLRERLAPGGTIFLLDCEKRWPATQLSERHFFQIGAVGGLEPDEYLEGSDRVAEYLEQYRSHRRAWDSPRPDGEFPEAEWGFEPALGEDVRRFADANGFRIRHVRYSEPEDLSPLVADLYRWWYRERRIRANRLVVESFILMEPLWALKTGSTPYWCKFPVESSADNLEKYLDSTDPYDEIHVMLFSHGTESAGIALPARWQQILERAPQGGFLGVDIEKFPRDFGGLARYHDEIRSLPPRYPLPGPLSMERFDAFLEGAGDRYAVRWDEGDGASKSRKGQNAGKGKAKGPKG